MRNEGGQYRYHVAVDLKPRRSWSVNVSSRSLPGLRQFSGWVNIAHQQVDDRRPALFTGTPGRLHHVDDERRGSSHRPDAHCSYGWYRMKRTVHGQNKERRRSRRRRVGGSSSPSRWRQRHSAHQKCRQLPQRRGVIRKTGAEAHRPAVYQHAHDLCLGSLGGVEYRAEQLQLPPCSHAERHAVRSIEPRTISSYRSEPHCAQSTVLHAITERVKSLCLVTHPLARVTCGLPPHRCHSACSSCRP